jgi:signal transduction histidine kinase
MPSDDADNALSPDALDQLQHDLKTSLTTISGHAQLLARAVRRTPSLTDEERRPILEALATIEEEVRTMVSLIDTSRRDGAYGPPGSEPLET